MNLPHHFPEIYLVKIDRGGIMTFYFKDGDRMKIFRDGAIYILLAGGQGAIVIDRGVADVKSFKDDVSIECPDRYRRDKISRYSRYHEDMFQRAKVRDFITVMVEMIPQQLHHWHPFP